MLFGFCLVYCFVPMALSWLLFAGCDLWGFDCIVSVVLFR